MFNVQIQKNAVKIDGREGTILTQAHWAYENGQLDEYFLVRVDQDLFDVSVSTPGDGQGFTTDDWNLTVTKRARA